MRIIVADTCKEQNCSTYYIQTLQLPLVLCSLACFVICLHPATCLFVIIVPCLPSHRRLLVRPSSFLLHLLLYHLSLLLWLGFSLLHWFLVLFLGVLLFFYKIHFFLSFSLLFPNLQSGVSSLFYIVLYYVCFIVVLYMWLGCVDVFWFFLGFFEWC